MDTTKRTITVYQATLECGRMRMYTRTDRATAPTTATIVEMDLPDMPAYYALAKANLAHNAKISKREARKAGRKAGLKPVRIRAADREATDLDYYTKNS